MADFGTNRLQKIELKDRRILVIATAEFWTQDNRPTQRKNIGLEDGRILDRRIAEYFTVGRENTYWTEEDRKIGLDGRILDQRRAEHWTLGWQNIKHWTGRWPFIIFFQNDRIWCRRMSQYWREDAEFQTVGPQNIRAKYETIGWVEYLTGGWLIMDKEDAEYWPEVQQNMDKRMTEYFLKEGMAEYLTIGCQNI